MTRVTRRPLRDDAKANRLALLFFISVGILGYCWYLGRQWMSHAAFFGLIGSAVFIGLVGGAIRERSGWAPGDGSSSNSAVVVTGAASLGLMLQAVAPVWVTTLVAAGMLCLVAGAFVGRLLKP